MDRLDAAYEELILAGGPQYRRIGVAHRCLAHLFECDFPEELNDEARTLFMISDYVTRSPDGNFSSYSSVPLGIQRRWLAAFATVYRAFQISLGASGTGKDYLPALNEEAWRIKARPPSNYYEQG